MSEYGLSGGMEVYVIVGAVVAAIIIAGAFFFLQIPLSGSSGSSGRNGNEATNSAVYITSWRIEPKIINATLQADGTSKWSGVVNITVYDQNGTGMPNVKVLLEGCGITAGGVTNGTGQVRIILNNVTLQPNQRTGSIKVTFRYEDQRKIDVIPVVMGNSEGETLVINYWTIVPNEINAITQSDGTATWSGTINITVYDQDGYPLQGVEVKLEGCGIIVSGVTNGSGTVSFHVTRVTLPQAVSEDTIEVTLSYDGQEKTDTITVVRAS